MRFTVTDMEHQAEILMVANDAAKQDGNGVRAALLMKEHSLERRIRIAFETLTPESIEENDVAERGWEDDVGAQIQVDADEIDEQIDDGSANPVTDAIVQMVAKFLRDEGANEPSSSGPQSFPVDVWYTSYDEVDYQTGETTNRSFFLDGFTNDETSGIFDEMSKPRRLR